MPSPLAEKVLVTGANGYVASHIVSQLFALGYDVVGTVRSASKGDYFVEKFPGFKYEIVTDLTNPGAFDKVFKSHPDIKYVLHTASPVLYKGTDYVNNLVKPAIDGTLSALKGARQYGKNVKKFVYTSSLAAASQYDKPEKSPELVITEASWDAITIEEANSSFVAGYCASKTLAEKTVWDFAETEKPNFTVSTIIVPMLYGPPIHDVTYETISTSITFFKALLELPKDSTKLPGGYAGISDVRDIARTHIQALKNPEFDNKRSFPLAQIAGEQLILDILHKFRPEETKDLATVNPGSFKVEDYYKFDNSETRSRLGFEFIPLAKTVLDTFDSFQILKKKGTARLN